MTDIAITETSSTPSASPTAHPGLRRTLYMNFDEHADQRRLVAERQRHERLAQAYVDGKTLLAVAQANHTSLREVRRALRATGRHSRRSGPSGLTADQHQLLLDADLAGTPHRIIAIQLGISAERVRQLARAAGRSPLRQRRRA